MKRTEGDSSRCVSRSLPACTRREPAILIAVCSPFTTRTPPWTPKALDFFKTLLETPSPSGYESTVQQFVRDYVAGFADEVRTDLHGNVIVARESRPPCA